MIETAQLKRVFKYAAMTLPDPGPQFSAEEVRNLYTNTYPELASAAIDGPEAQDDALVYTFRKAVGTKGATRHTTPAGDAVRQALQDVATHGGDEGMPSETCARAWFEFAQRSLRAHGSERLSVPAGVATLLGPVL